MTEGWRRLLGRNATIASRQAVYEIEDGIEVDSTEQYELSRRRVLFEDVVLITYHREIGWPHMLANGFVLLVVLVVVGSIVGSNGPASAAIITALFGLPSLVLIIIRLILKLDVVTVFGRRSKARIRFAYQKREGRQVYARLCSRTREVQDRIAGVAPSPEAPPVEEAPVTGLP